MATAKILIVLILVTFLFVLLALMSVTFLSTDLSKADSKLEKAKPKHKVDPKNIPSNFSVVFTVVKKFTELNKPTVLEQQGLVVQDLTPGNEKLVIRTETNKFSNRGLKILVIQETLLVRRENRQYIKVSPSTFLSIS